MNDSMHRTNNASPSGSPESLPLGRSDDRSKQEQGQADEPQGAPEAARSGGRIPEWIVGIALVGMLLVFVTGFLIGRSGVSQARSELRRVRSDHEGSLREARAELARAQTDLTSVRAVNRMLTARGFLYRAAAQLDRRNFGAAQSDLRRAVLTLGNAPSAAGTDPQALTQLRDTIAVIGVRVTNDVAEQRSQILQTVEKLDRLIGPGQPSPT